MGLGAHRPALRAALRGVYGIDLREVMETHSMPVSDLADLVEWLPAGSVFWVSVGGPAAISNEARELRKVSFWLRVLDWRERGSKGERPRQEPEPKWATERATAAKRSSRKADAYFERQRRAAQAGD